MLILAVVAIRAVQNTGIITHAKNASSETTIAQEKEQITLALNNWKIEKSLPGNTQTFAEYMEGKIEGATITDNGDGTVTVSFEKTRNAYIVAEDGTITPTKGISITATGFPLKIEDGATEMPTGTLKAVLIDIEGTVTWSIGDTAVATISATEGEEITVTAVAKGETKITATCGEYKAEYTIKVTQPVNIAKGAFVKYDVAYTDAYYSNYQYTATNGWRLLDYTDNGDGTLSNVKLISTGIPARLYYSWSGKINNNWWVTDDTMLTSFRGTLGGEDYNFYTGESTYYSLQGSAGLYHNFGDIKFAYGITKDEGNKGYFTSITNGTTTYGTYTDANGETQTNEEETTGNDLFKVKGIDATVRLLTLPELNKALGKTDIDSLTGFSDSTGLYRLSSISTAGIGLDSNTYTRGYYWLASPDPSTDNYHYVCNVIYSGGVYHTCATWDYGVRPVVCLTSNVQIEDTDGDGVLEIQ